MIINSRFDGGNIRCIDCCSAQHIQLAINPDAENTQTLQWFYFRLSGARGQACRLTITNAGDASYLDGWKGYRAVASYNRRDWFRIDTRYEAGQLIMEVEPQQNCMYFAYFAPYSLERLADFVAGIKQSPVVDSSELGQTLDGRTIECLTIGDALTGK
ncbi:MAG: M14-type cytosolic carboxypeptidase, partial [Exilibacterium sp.]